MPNESTNPNDESNHEGPALQQRALKTAATPTASASTAALANDSYIYRAWSPRLRVPNCRAAQILTSTEDLKGAAEFGDLVVQVDDTPWRSSHMDTLAGDNIASAKGRYRPSDWKIDGAGKLGSPGDTVRCQRDVGPLGDLAG
jgi:hypothetical protein